jgi:hypothetical protein
MPDHATVVKLDVTVSGREVTAKLTFLNHGQDGFPLEKFNTAPGGKMDKELFEVTTAATPRKEVRYVGITAKRPPSGPGDYVTLASGKSLSATVRLDQSYAFPPEGGAFVARYSVYNAMPDGELVQLVSNPVTFQVAKSN